MIFINNEEFNNHIVVKMRDISFYLQEHYPRYSAPRLNLYGSVLMGVVELGE